MNPTFSGRTRYSRPFPAANAHFVPWEHVPALVEMLEQFRTEFSAAAEKFIADYPGLCTGWQTAHPEILDAAYAQAWELHGRFSFGWHSFKVAGAGEYDTRHRFNPEMQNRMRHRNPFCDMIRSCSK